MDIEDYRVLPGEPARLAERNPDGADAFDGDKGDAKARLKELNHELEELQETLYAERKHKVLIVLQATDTGGKDGTIRHVFEGVNPQGVRVARFVRPTPEELDHDYLWRVHPHTPARGEIAIFNRSHYEDVLIVRVAGLVPEEVWRRRYRHIREFERMLADEGTTILKFFLHIDKDEQKERLQARLDNPRKHWKFDPGDLKERRRWDAYQAAFEEAISETSTEAAPWYVVPANRKWFRNLTVATVVVETLRGLNMTHPEAGFDPASFVIE